jgi:hypothetical protein
MFDWEDMQYCVFRSNQNLRNSAGVTSVQGDTAVQVHTWPPDRARQRVTDN